MLNGHKIPTTKGYFKLAEQQQQPTPRKIGIFKCGNIGTSPCLELLLDELADRRDIKVRTVTTGSKMGA